MTLTRNAAGRRDARGVSSTSLLKKRKRSRRRRRPKRSTLLITLIRRSNSSSSTQLERRPNRNLSPSQVPSPYLKASITRRKISKSVKSESFVHQPRTYISIFTEMICSLLRLEIRLTVPQSSPTFSTAFVVMGHRLGSARRKRT